MPLGNSSFRLRLMLGLLVLAVSTAMVRAFILQAYDAQAYAQQAAAQMETTRTQLPLRGQIVDRNGVVLAGTQPAMLVYADPMMLARNGVPVSEQMGPKQTKKANQAPDAVAAVLAKYLGGTPESYVPTLTDQSKKHYAIIQRQVPAYTWVKMKDELSRGRWYGLFATQDPIRYYPAGDVASNVIGWATTTQGDKRFAQGTIVGAGGLEYSLNSQLSGKPGTETYLMSANGKIPGWGTLVPATNGTSYGLTIDAEMQVMANQALAAGVAKAGAATGTAIVMNVKTGEILAMSNSPTFDSSQYGKAAAANLGNRAAEAAYEPGSVQKVITMAMLADQNLVSPTTRVVVPPSLMSGDRPLKDAFAHPTIYLTARGVIANSSNIGTALLARNLPKPLMAEYLKAFGFGQRTSLGLPLEGTGEIPGPTMADYTRDQVAFGQGLSVTAVQEAAAVAAIANGGVYNAPYLLKTQTTTDGVTSPVPHAAPHRVISPQASAAVLNMMEAVITLKKARAIDNYRMAGKTGTAQRYDPTCRCYRGYTASFVGVAPVENPQILVYVVIDQPTLGSEGSMLALPVAQEIMKIALPRYGVLPSTTQPSDLPLTYTP